MQPQLKDEINHPSHYIGERVIELSKVIKAWQLNYHLGNVLKYINRAGRKGDEADDLQKAIWYIDDFLRTGIIPLPTTPIYGDEYFQFSIMEIALDWDLSPKLKEALEKLYFATKHQTVGNIESVRKALVMRLKFLKQQGQYVNDN